jgi:periplasmic protein TonB
MRDPFSRSGNFLSSQDSWLQRVRENFHQLVAPTRIFPRSANGAPIHLLQHSRSARSGQAQSASLVMHAAVIGTLLLLAAHSRIIGPAKPPGPLGDPAPQIFSSPHDLLNVLRSLAPVGGTSSGQGHDTLPTRHGDLPPLSSIQFLKPSIPNNQVHDLPVPPTILDTTAPPVLKPVDIGLPWMPERNNSSGIGKGKTIGNGPDDGSMGDIPGKGVGVGGPPGPYRVGGTEVKCAYCPDPQYTDEAREAKLQGHVMLQVLVGADGRAAQVRIVQAIGLGLDERAAQAVRGWKFVPAYDAAHHPVASWITVEAMFRLF